MFPACGGQFLNIFQIQCCLGSTPEGIIFVGKGLKKGLGQLKGGEKATVTFKRPDDP